MSHSVKILSSFTQIFSFTTIWMIGVCVALSSPVRADSINQADLCTMESAQFDAQRATISQALNDQGAQANPLRAGDAKQQLHDLQIQQLKARVAFFSGRVSSYVRTNPDHPNTKLTGTFVEGQKDFSSFQGTVLRFDSNAFTNVYTLSLLVKCSATQPSIIFRTYVTDAALSANYLVIGDHYFQAPRTDLARLRPKLAALNVGDAVTMTGVALLFLYEIQTDPSHMFVFLNRSEQLPPQSPETGGMPNMSNPTRGPGSGYQATPTQANGIAVTYEVQLTDIQKN